MKAERLKEQVARHLPSACYLLCHLLAAYCSCCYILACLLHATCNTCQSQRHTHSTAINWVTTKVCTRQGRVQGEAGQGRVRQGSNNDRHKGCIRLVNYTHWCMQAPFAVCVCDRLKIYALRRVCGN